MTFSTLCDRIFAPRNLTRFTHNKEADYNKNALEKAKSYSSMMSMSKEAIYDQLVSEYGEQFTDTEAQYAIDHLE